MKSLSLSLCIYFVLFCVEAEAKASIDGFIVSVNTHICQTWANKFVSFIIWFNGTSVCVRVCVSFCGLLLFCLYRVKWNLRASGTVPFWLFWPFHSFICIHSVYVYLCASWPIWLLFSFNDFIFQHTQQKINVSDKNRPFLRGRGGIFFFSCPCSYTYTNFRLRIWHQCTHYTRTHTYACTKIYTIQNNKTKPGDNPENERNGTDCNDVSIKRAGATQTYTHTRALINVSALYLSLQTVLCADTIYVVYVFA